MGFIIRANGNDFTIEQRHPAHTGNIHDNTPLAPTDYQIDSADTLLRLYVATDRETPLFSALQQVRGQLLADLDGIETRAEIYGLIHWLLDDHGIRADGASLEETADRLSDLDIAADSDQYTAMIFHLKDAVDRLYEMELDDI